MDLNIKPSGSKFVRPNGRDGHWNNDGSDDEVECPFAFVEVHGRDAERAFDQLRSNIPNETPILLGSPHEASMLFEGFEFHDKSTGELIAKAENFDIEEWFRQQETESRKLATQYNEVWPPSGAWPTEHRPGTRLAVPNDILNEDKPKPVIIIALLPTSDASTAAAHLKFGDWNECPSPHIHIALARRWAGSHGAVQICNTYEIIEFRVDRPVTNREEGLRMAREQYLYCNDIVDQGTDTLEVLADTLVDSRYWYFWWD